VSKCIIFHNENGFLSIVHLASDKIDVNKEAKKVVPEGVHFEIVEKSELPDDRTFRNAWKKNGTKCETCLDTAKSIAHDLRRSKRSKEFAPLDIKATIPTEAESAEIERQAIREKYDAIQKDIDSSGDEASLKFAMVNNGLI
jgi:hypothetical protein